MRGRPVASASDVPQAGALPPDGRGAAVPACACALGGTIFLGIIYQSNQTAGLCGWWVGVRLPSCRVIPILIGSSFYLEIREIQ